MTQQPHYGTIAKVFHWLIVAFLVIQYPLGWLMPDIHRGMQPGDAMTWHISIGTIILALIAMRLAWRLTHPVAPESSQPRWQRLSSEAAHWSLYVLVLATTLSGWLFASARGWRVSWLFAVPLPMPTAENPQLGKAIDGWHQYFEWALLILIGVHVAAALIHLLYYRDGVMQRMLPLFGKYAKPAAS